MALHDSPGIGAIVAALPLLVMIFLLGVKRTPAWVAALAGLGTAMVLARLAYAMPLGRMVAAMSYGAAFGLFPIAWVVIWAILLYRLTVETGNFEVLSHSVASLTPDRRLQTLLIAFAFGAFLEAAAGFGAPVAVAAAMLTGLGFARFDAACACLLANTAPVAFGSLGIPIITLAVVTGLPLLALSRWVGCICAPVSAVIPAYLILVTGGRTALKGVMPAVLVCGLAFAGVQLLASMFIGPQLTGILSSLAAMAALVVLITRWTPRDSLPPPDAPGNLAAPRHGPKRVFVAWLPYLLLVLLMFLWGWEPVKKPLDKWTTTFHWPGLPTAQSLSPPGIPSSNPAALYKLNLLTASGTACMFAVLLSTLLLRVTPRRLGRVMTVTARQLAFPVLTIVSMLSFAFLMNYSGATAAIGLAFAATGRAFPFFSAILGWLGVFLVGSDTSSNALFGNLQAVTAAHLGLDPVLMAAANACGGIMGKMISLSSIAVAAAATGLPASDEGRLFRFTLKHSLILSAAVAVLVALFAWLL